MAQRSSIEPGSTWSFPGGEARTAFAREEPRAAGAPRLWLAHLTLAGFRNFRQAELSCDGRPVVLSGPNGAGKTNILEAVSLLAPGRGLRGARLEEIAQSARTGDNRDPLGPSAGTWGVTAELETPLGRRRIATGRGLARVGPGSALGEESGGQERRQIKLDGKPVGRQQVLAEVLAAVWVTPQMDRLFLEGPAARRRFLDRLVYGFEPAHAGRVAAYEKTLRQRARLLAEDQGEETWLSSLEQSMAEKAVAIAAARRRTVERLAGASQPAGPAFPEAGVALAGDAEAWLAEAPAAEVEERLARRLSETRRLDAQRGGAAVGAHRSDLLVTHLASGLPAALSSTGEQKALLLSLVLAFARLLELERGEPPLLLLDEVAAHLDAKRRAALYEALLALGAQAWLSGTDAGLFAPLGTAAQGFRLDEGAIIRESQ